MEIYREGKIFFDVRTRRYVLFGANAATTWRRRLDGSWTQVRRIIPRREHRAVPPPLEVVVAARDPCAFDVVPRDDDAVVKKN